MLPATLAQDVKRQIRHYLEATFNFRRRDEETALSTFINHPKTACSRGHGCNFGGRIGRRTKPTIRRSTSISGRFPSLSPSMAGVAAAVVQGTQSGKHDRHDWHWLGQDRVLPIPAARPLPALGQAGREGRQGHHPLSDERAGGRSGRAIRQRNFFAPDCIWEPERSQSAGQDRALYRARDTGPEGANRGGRAGTPPRSSDDASRGLVAFTSPTTRPCRTIRRTSC